MANREMRIRGCVGVMCAIWRPDIALHPNRGLGAVSLRFHLGHCSLGTVSGSLGASNAGQKGAITAWADYVNANGGIDGHKIKLIDFDDQGSPSTALTDVQTLVQQDHAIAIVGDYSVVEPVWSPYIQTAKEPVIGGTLAGSYYFTNPYFFATGTLPPTTLTAGIALAKKEGGTKTADLVCAESPLCVQAICTLNDFGRKGLGRTGRLQRHDRREFPSYTAECLAAKAAGANIMNIGDDSNTDLRVYENCAQRDTTRSLLGALPS